MRGMVLVGVLAFQGAAHHTVFVVDKVTETAEAHNQPFGGIGASAGEHYSAPVVMAEFAKKCPSVSFTQDQSAAEYVLQTQSGGSTLLDPKGNVLYVSPAKQLHNMVKDVCTFLEKR